jgi:hypothetical protein
VGPEIREIKPAQMVCVGRCDLPGSPFGCKTDEFGSGYAETGSDAPSAAEAEARPSSTDEVERLIQQITDLVMNELSGS